MPSESPRIADLRRRVEADPSSIAFAQLAEEYRRAGNYEAAEQCCRTGLTRHPAYLSARVTLGRTLIELDKLDEAEHELQFVLKSAPDNLAAIRGMAEIHQRRGNLETALDFFRRALPLARHDPEIEETVKQINRDLGAAARPEQSGDLSFAQAQDEFLSALSRIPEASAQETPVQTASPVQPAAPAAPAAPASTSTLAPSHPRTLASASARAESHASYGETSPKRPEIESREGGPEANEPIIDFDSLLQSLGTPDHQAPPMVEALLTEPIPPAVRPEPVLPELPVETPASDPFADLERGLRAFDRPVAEHVDAGPHFEELPQPAAQPEPTLAYGPPSLAQDPSASFGGASPMPLAEGRDASFGGASEIAPVAPRAPDAPVAPAADTAQSILDELEAWLAAIKR